MVVSLFCHVLSSHVVPSHFPLLSDIKCRGAMSLNGLDSDAVVQAHHAALAEAGGWYVERVAGQGSVADPILTGFYSNTPIAIPWSC